jgi:hypothetical protein
MTPSKGESHQTPRGVSKAELDHVVGGYQQQRAVVRKNMYGKPQWYFENIED